MKTAMKKYISALLFSALIVAGVSYYHYYKEEQHFNNEIDTKILHAAQIAHYIVGDHFHEKALISPPTLIQDNHQRAFFISQRRKNELYIFIDS